MFSRGATSRFRGWPGCVLAQPCSTNALATYKVSAHLLNGIRTHPPEAEVRSARSTAGRPHAWVLNGVCQDSLLPPATAGSAPQKRQQTGWVENESCALFRIGTSSNNTSFCPVQGNLKVETDSSSGRSSTTVSMSAQPVGQRQVQRRRNARLPTREVGICHRVELSDAFCAVCKPLASSRRGPARRCQWTVGNPTPTQTCPL